MRTRGLVPTLVAVCVVAAALPARAEDDPQVTALIGELGLIESAEPVRARPGWVRPQTIVVRGSAANAAFLQEGLDGVTVLAAGSAAAALPLMAEADAAIGFCEPELVAAAPKLQWIQIGSAGLNGCLVGPDYPRKDILLTNMQRVQSAQIAEHAIAMALTLARGLDLAVQRQADGRWDKSIAAADRPWTLAGRTLLVVGLGGIGTEVARRAHGLGMRVVATRNSSRAGPDFVETVGLADELPDLIGEADVVVNAAPLTAATAGLFDAALIARMKRGALFINVGRGASVDTAALIAALESGALGGAGLDVTDPEPLPAAHPLWRAPNVVITPHIASTAEDKWDRYWLVVRANLKRYVAGDRVFSVVDVAQGY